MYADTVIHEGETIPKDIVLYVPEPSSSSIPFVGQETTVYLGQVISGGVEIYPIAGHVRTPDAYGPTGTEYTGTEVLPTEAEVKTGVGFGAGGTEFTGTLSGGAGGGNRIFLPGVPF